MKEKKERKLSVLFLPFFFWPCCATYGISVSRPGIEPTPPALDACSLSQWTTREDQEKDLNTS